MTNSNQKRRTDRVSLALTALVKVKEHKDDPWKETTDLISISRTGAGFYLNKKCEIGRLVSITMAMPKHLRCYDQDRELYRVWGLVQHCSPASGNDEETDYHVGVAFVGRRVPQSYHENPRQSYRIAGMSEEGVWRIVEAQSDFVVRRHPRYWVSLNVSLSALDDDKEMIADENAVTENISASGAAVFSELDVNVGDSVDFDCGEHMFSALAIVRNRQVPLDGLPKLHIEFVDAAFPMESVRLESEADESDDDEQFTDNEITEERTNVIEETVEV